MGEETPLGLDTMSPSMVSAWRYHRWIYDHFQRWVQGRVLEVGAGHGIYTTFLLADAVSVVATDIDLGSLELVQSRLGDSRLSFRQLDLLEDVNPEALGGKFDIIICLNVLEHISQDEQALVNMAKLLNPGGYLVIATPAFQQLFSALDEFAGHYRRYTKYALGRLMESAGLQVIQLEYYNVLGVLGWMFYGKVLRPKSIRDESVSIGVRFFDRAVVPFAKLADILTFHAVGLSVLAVARKSAGTELVVSKEKK